MAMRFSILGSGSSGNAALLITDSTRILIDAGFSARKLEGLLSTAGESLSRLDAIFLTHEHSDHAAGVEGLRKFSKLPIFANSATSRAIQQKLDPAHQPAWQLFETGARFQFRDLEIESFTVPHDAHDPVGFRFTAGREDDLFSPRRSLVFLTDLGHAPQHIREHLRACDVVVVEANHCSELLKADNKRPWSTKQRIAGRHGHLSNEAVRELLAAVASPQWSRVYLTHLSRDCNSAAAIETALAGVRATLATCDFTIVGADESTPFYEL